MVVSLDYIKSDRHRAHFLSIAPECIIVDEAHTCSTGGRGKQLRFELLQHLAEEEERHVILLTATPHSGDDSAFHNLLSILRRDFAGLAEGHEATRQALREDLARHFVQRRRKDIEEWREVRCTMLYGQDNPVDGFILKVIVRKAEAIRRELGVLVPLPQDEKRINQAMIKAALMKRNRAIRQMELDLDDAIAADLRPLETAWEDALEKARANPTKFAQRRIKPEEVLPEWQKQLELIGDEASIRRFVTNACTRLGTPLEPARQAWRFVPRHLPDALRERLAQENLNRELLVDFHYPSRQGAQFISRTHPLVAILADTLLEAALQEESPLAARCAATVCGEVEVVTTLFLLRLRHQLTYRKRDTSRTLMAEETVAIALEGRQAPRWLDDADVIRLLEVTPSGNLADDAAIREIEHALAFCRANTPRLEELARQRAETLLQDHRRVRQAAADVGSYKVSPCLPVDVIDAYVLLPDRL